MPALTSFSWWLLGTVGHATATAGFFIGFGAAGLDLVPVWIGSALGLVVPPGAGVGGYYYGKLRQRQAETRALAIEDIDAAATAALGRDVRGLGAKALSQKVAAAMRHGRPERAKLLTASGYVEYRIDPVDDATVTIEPVEESPEASAFNQIVRAVNPSGRPLQGTDITVPTDRRVAELERRLSAIERAGKIDASHPSYPQFVILQIDRLTEYRQLASRAEAIAEVDSPEARQMAVQLASDLDDMVELMTAGVAELERQVLADTKRSSDAQLGFLREKYAAGEPRTGPVV
ncbi:hypothetical protein GCM10011490_10650 [Pseudoclavibacter endophyticus]|nr:hypothetical protein GCM10011490_10650 [Pseudoclavibacter endophyticus]